MQRLFTAGAAVCALLLSGTVFYTACGDQSPAPLPQTCQRQAAYTTRAELDAHHILTLLQWLEDKQITLTAEQQQKLNTTNHLVGEFLSQLDRPIKHPNGAVEMPSGWLKSLPEDHPWQTPPAINDSTFAAWFEVRIVNPLLFDGPDNWFHEDWAAAYLELVAKQDMLTSLVGVDSGCP